ncbi:MAG: tRNA (adenosine(37)-N6)-threonylcarbamoyltransferase complex dimerization subunit type 1 TsaB [Desulfobacteraceae bacterium]
MSSCYNFHKIGPDEKSKDSFSHLLSVDTATQACSVAISHGNSLVVENTNITCQTHSRHLLNMIQHALVTARLKLSDLDGFVVTKGPGSFTGLRIGLSTVKGLAMAVGKPMVGVSYLQCLALQSGVKNGLVCTVIDARKSECYYALYRFGNSGLQTVVSESVGSLKNMVEKITEPCLFIGNGFQPYQKQLYQSLGQLALFAPDFQNILRAYTAIWAGRSRFLEGCGNQLDSLTPEYIRKSDAQINIVKQLFNN